MRDTSFQVHPIPPVWDDQSKILILGSFPSVKSRESGFFYGHPQNRFWKVLSAVYREPCPLSISEKRSFLLRNGVAVWDVVASCSLTGSADSSIRDVIPNDLTPLLSSGRITRIFANGGTAGKLYQKYQFPETGIQAVVLPSTSPANAAWSLSSLTEAWRSVLT